MAPASDEPAWAKVPPAAYDIVTCWYPENERPDQPGSKLRPALVLAVLQGQTTGLFACRIAYGTKILKIIKRKNIDLIVEDHQSIGLPRPTRFDLDKIGTFVWAPPFFGCWRGYTTPKVGALSELLIKEYAFIKMTRDSV